MSTRVIALDVAYVSPTDDLGASWAVTNLDAMLEDAQRTAAVPYDYRLGNGDEGRIAAIRRAFPALADAEIVPAGETRKSTIYAAVWDGRSSPTMFV